MFVVSKFYPIFLINKKNQNGLWYHGWIGECIYCAYVICKTMWCNNV